jgi:hypothetical protein
MTLVEKLEALKPFLSAHWCSTDTIDEAIKALSSTDGDDGEPWRAMLALVKAADDAAKWIAEARSGARKDGTISSLPSRPNTSPGARGEREMRNLRAAIRKAKDALNLSEGGVSR